MRALLVCLALLLPASAHAEGAIARDSDSNRVGLSYGFNRTRDADRRALEECGANDCRIVSHFENACAAIATSRSGGYGFARRPRLRAAQEASIGECENQGNRGCGVAVSGCDE